MQVGTNWGGNYSRFTFDEAKRYYMMLKEQGVPILDDEFNLLQESILTNLRRWIQDGYGDAAVGNSFKIEGTGAANDFTIKGGDGTADGAAHIYVAGYLIVLPADTTYTGQPITQAALTTPAGDRTDEVYLDVWLDEVGPADDSGIVDPSIAIETSRRLQLKWAVKVAQGGVVPSPYTDANNLRHHTYRLATLNRTAQATITAEMVVDRRGVMVAMPTHLADGAAHGATSAAAANAIIRRDANGRAKVAAPSAADDIARKDTVDALIPSGTVMLFQQTNAPTGWTKLTTYDNRALRVVSGTAGAGGTVEFTDAFTGRTVSSTTAGGTVGGTTLTTAQIPSHTHSYMYTADANYGTGGYPSSRWNEWTNTGATGGGNSHTHSFTGVAHNHTLDMAVQYVDVIFASKN